MAQLILNATNEKAQSIIEALEARYPSPLINIGTEEEPDMQPEHVGIAHVKWYIIKHLKAVEAKHRQKRDRDAIKYEPDEDLLS